jgi:ketosteroid isomerase-like protein
MVKKVAAAAIVACTMFSTIAWAGPLETARAVDQRFDDAILACKPDNALELFENDALAIFPGQGEMERGKVAISRLVNNFSKAFCPNELKASTLRNASYEVTPLGADYIMIVRVIDATDRNGARAQFRATELLHQMGGKWLYLVDHISVGLPSASDSDKP